MRRARKTSFSARPRPIMQVTAGLAAAIFLSACGGGGDEAVGSEGTGNPPPAPAPEPAPEPAPAPAPPNVDPDLVGLFPGFTGDRDWLLNGAEGDAVGEGADGDGGVGVGGALGQFRGATVSATLEDGTSLGSAVIDASGMVTVRPGRDYRGALLVEVRGGNGAQYYDEAKQAYLSFDAAQVLRARVPAITGNIGVTPLTEAVARHMEANPGTGSASLPDRIRESARVVRDAANALLPAEYDIAELSRLPVLLNPDSGQGAATDTERGRYALLLAGLANLAATNNPSLPAPALALSNQLAADLTDGVINGVDSNGQRAATQEQSTYRAADLPRDLTQAIVSADNTYGEPPAVQPAPQPVQFGLYAVRTATGALTNVLATLYDSGDVTARTIQANGEQGPETALASNVRRLYSGVDNLATTLSLLIQDTSGNVFGYGVNDEPSYRLTVDSSLIGSGQAVPALNNMTAMGFGSNHQLALTASGQVLAWGDNEQGQLTGNSGAPVAQPIVVPGLDQPAYLVAATSNVSVAAMQDGTVLTWGTDLNGALGQGQLQARLVAPGVVQTASGPLTDVVGLATCFRTVNALRRDGSVWAWGDDGLGLLGTDSDARATAAPIPGLPPMRKIVMGFDGAYGLAQSGDLWYWGLTANQEKQLPIQVAGLSGLLDVQTTGLNGVIAIGDDSTTGLAYGQISQ